jgi:hypothetical protein
VRGTSGTRIVKRQSKSRAASRAPAPPDLEQLADLGGGLADLGRLRIV